MVIYDNTHSVVCMFPLYLYKKAHLLFYHCSVTPFPCMYIAHPELIRDRIAYGGDCTRYIKNSQHVCEIIPMSYLLSITTYCCALSIKSSFFNAIIFNSLSTINLFIFSSSPFCSWSNFSVSALFLISS